MKAAKFPLLLTAIGTSVQARSLTFTSFDAQTLAPDDVREYANSNELNRIDFNVMIDESGDSFTCEAANIQGQEGVAAVRKHVILLKARPHTKIMQSAFSFQDCQDI